jgi:outer membrane receptor protein involved in Fe transport
MNKTAKWGVLLATAIAAKGALAQETTESPEVEEAVAENPANASVEIDIPGGEIVILSRRDSDVQKATTQVISLLSAADIARTGDGDIAGALGRVTGLNVVGGGFVYVRGLGDRYSLALLNGSPLPSPEPLRRAVPLDLFPTDVVASSMVQKTYSPNFPGEFGGGVINLTTLAIPKAPFLNFSVGGSGDTETTDRLGYDYFGGKSDWTGYDNGGRSLPPALKAFFSSGERISAGNVNASDIAKQLVNPSNGLVQKIGGTVANLSTSLSGGNSWLLDGSELGLIATAGFSNKWRTREGLEQTPGSTDLSATNKDYRNIATENRVVANALLGVGLEFGDGHKLRWTNLYVHDTLKRTSLAEGKWNITYTDWDFREQNTAWYERELLSTQLSGGFRRDPISIDARASYSQSTREAPFELGLGYARNNVTADPYGAHFVNRLSGQNRNFADIAFSNLNEDLMSAGVDVTWRVRPGLVASAGYDFVNTERDSARREFQIRASSTFPAAVGMFRPDLLLAPGIIDFYQIGLVETTESDPAFAARLRTQAAYAQIQAELLTGLELSVGARVERGEQDVRPLQVFSTLTNSGASTRIDNDNLLPSATLTYRLSDEMQMRFNISKTIARPQFRELMFQRFYDPEANREFLGNPLLSDSEFLNGEARFEWYFAPEQRVSVAAFYKSIDRPIEAYTSYPEGDTPVTSFANAPKATLYGVEAELHKYFSLDRFSDAAIIANRRAVVIGNYTFTDSTIKVGPGDTVDVFGSTATTRAATDYFVQGGSLTGQSDHLVNLQLGLESVAGLSQQTILLSYASDRVASRGGGNWPDIYESPGLMLDVVARQGLNLFGQNLELKLEARNILQRDFREYQRRGANVIYYNRYDAGARFAASVSAKF